MAKRKCLQLLCLAAEPDTLWSWLRGNGYNSFTWERQDASGYNQQHSQGPWMLVGQDFRELAFDVVTTKVRWLQTIRSAEASGNCLIFLLFEVRSKLGMPWLRLWLRGSDCGFFLVGCGRTTMATADNVPDGSGCQSTRVQGPAF